MSATFGEITPHLDAFRDLAQGRRVIPVTRRVLADGHTAVGLFRALCAERAGTFLLESAEQGIWSRYSFIGVRSAAMLTERHGAGVWRGRVPRHLPSEGSPVDLLRDTVKALHTLPLDGMPPLTGGMVGYLAYDAVRHWERVPDDNRDPLGLPEMAFLLASDLAVLDHSDGSLLLIANAINYDDSDAGVDEAWRDAVRRLDRMQADLRSATAPRVDMFDRLVPDDVTAWTDEADYLAGVDAVKEYVRAGDAFQVVLAQRFSVPCTASGLDVYRILRATNPSPYMYYLRVPTDDGAPADDVSGVLSERTAFEIVGSSPEALVTVSSGECVVHPIAGTRPRGATPEADTVLAEDLLADEKERAEHLMLVDLARNDIGRVCRYGSIRVPEFMVIERYSHVMHIVSQVEGDIDPNRTAFDLLRATFPAGTVSGAPKVRAMQIIAQKEPVQRGAYAGALGYFGYDGNMDTCITLRTALLRQGMIHIQAGAGIVADSLPAAEFQETVNKASALFKAVAMAEQF